jgi:uncharacterized protein (DUF924 family)
MSPKAVLDFWFSATAASRWFRSTEAFDTDIRRRFSTTWEAARAGRLNAWGQSARGCLALVVVLDQLPLNMFRGQPASFATEAQARAVAERAIAQGWDQQLDDRGKQFLYLPFMHSEHLADQDRSVALFEAAGLRDNLRWARHHREIVRRFGRFPHRNAILGRTSTTDEQAWLASPDAFNP